MPLGLIFKQYGVFKDLNKVCDFNDCCCVLSVNYEVIKRGHESKMPCFNGLNKILIPNMSRFPSFCLFHSSCDM